MPDLNLSAIRETRNLKFGHGRGHGHGITIKTRARKIMFHTVVSPILEMRKSPQGDTEVVSQALFSEEIKILEEKGEWTKISTTIDNYEGWAKRAGIGSKNAPYLEQENYTLLTTDRLSAHLYAVPDTVYGPMLTLPFESKLLCPNFIDSRWLSVELPDGSQAFVQSGDVSIGNKQLKMPEIEAFSQRFLGLPYTWGGRSSFGYDCSGFVQMLYRQMGIFLPRDAKDQFLFSELTDCSLSSLNLGDLIFFGFAPDQIRHVGLSLGENRFIHTSAVTENQPYLRISSLNDPAWNGTGYYPFLAGKRCLAH